MRRVRIRASQIAEFLGSPLIGEDLDVHRAAPAQEAEAGCLTFLKKPTPERIATLNGAGRLLALVTAESAQDVTSSRIVVANPRLALARVLSRFFVQPEAAAIASTARIDSSARIGEGVSVGPFAVIGEDVVIGRGSVVRDRVTIYEGTVIGANCVIKAGAVLGEEGFGFEFDEQGRPVRIPHLGRVVIGDEVEVGVNSVIARGTLGETRIADRVKIDDHVHIAHNVSIGEDTLITACAQIAGSVKIGRGAWIGPNASVINGTEIGADSMVGIGAVVTGPVPENVVASGFPARVLRDRYPG